MQRVRIAVDVARVWNICTRRFKFRLSTEISDLAMSFLKTSKQRL
ncbi:hypothetical protein Gogos_009070 [Gossypium gossypioides]|uniref:Uncharacterized protein n=1 Tax=Gossypium gossypioides TaxID=34282 RepID=A0A7J9CDG1_GOSGO|nr:hypothetical protein [Gossypium gossypioides]